MKKGAKPVFFIVAALILIVAYLAFFGIHTMNGDYAVTYIKGGNDIRWGIDIRGGVDVTFAPSEGVDATDEQMASAKAVIEQRLLNLNITDSECTWIIRGIVLSYVFLGKKTRPLLIRRRQCRAWHYCGTDLP